MFLVAESLGMMVWQVEQEMPPEEFYKWLAYFMFKQEEEKKALEKAKRKGNKRG